MTELTFLNTEYEQKYGFKETTTPVFATKQGLNENVIREISAQKAEPEWMLELRLKAFKIFLAKSMPNWGADLSHIDFDKITYYLKPSENKASSWDDVPEKIKNTFERLGIPEAERKFLGGVGAQYECLEADSMVFTIEGPVKIKDIKKGDLVFSFDEKKNSFVLKKVNGVVCKGERNVFDVKIRGRKISVTQNHPFLALVHEKKLLARRGRYYTQWQYLSELRSGDLIAITKRLPIRGKSHSLKSVISLPRDQKVMLPKETSIDVMWFFGLFCGDGFVHQEKGKRKARIEIAIPEQDVQLRTELSRITKKLFSLEAKKPDVWRLSINSTVLCQWLQQVGICGTALTKKVPTWFFTLPREQILAFLGGYVDADGYVRNSKKNHDVSITSANKSLLESVVQLCMYVGISTSAIQEFKSRHPLKKTVFLTGFRVQLSGEFDELLCRSEKRLERMRLRKHIHDFSSCNNSSFRKHTNQEIGFAKINSITPAGVRPVYDIEVEDSHNFVSQGVVVHNSEVVYHKLREDLEAKGVVFLDTDTALKTHSSFFKQWFGKVVPAGDNKFSALNTAVWSGGTFIYIPQGVHVDIPLQAYFRINAKNMGQFERTLIIVDKDASVHYIEGCTAPVYSTDSLHSAVVELVALPGAKIRYTTIQNWSGDVFNLVTKRAFAYENAIVEWIDGNLGCLAVNSKVFLTCGIKNIQDVQKGDFVWCVDEQYKITSKRVIATKKSGVQAVFKLQTLNHRELTATANHPFLVMQKKGKWRSLGWVSLDKIQPGDLVAISGAMPDKGTPFVLPKSRFVGRKKISCPTHSSDELLWFLGFYLGDGYTDKSRVYLAVPKEDPASDVVEQYLNSLFGVVPARKGVVLRVGSVDLVSFLRSVEMKGRAQEKRVPEWIFRLTESQRRAFIDGYIAADGHARSNHKNISITSCNRLLLEDIKLLAITCGLNPMKISKWTRKELKPLGKEMKEYTHYFLYFGENQFTQPLQFVPVTKIIAQGCVDTYDLEIEGAHNFIANGLVVHNSKITMKYPSVVLLGKGARADILSVAYAGKGQHQDAGGKAIHLAPHTSSRIVSKSVCKDGGRTSYRGLLKVAKNCPGVVSSVRCDALLLDEQSRSDTYPTMQIDEDQVTIGHEASVGKVGEDQLHYVMSRGLSESQALALIVLGFISEFTKELPMEYAIELNKLIQLNMEDSVG